MKLSSLFVVFALLLNATLVLAQNNSHIDPCNAMPSEKEAVKSFLTFDQFDKELRIALTRQDPLLLAVLVKFPLRVNDDGGSISINDPQALQTHFQKVFTPAVRKEVLDDKSEKTGCLETGLDYGRGVVWVDASKRGYAITVVNRDAVPPYSTMNKPEASHIEFLCQTKAHRIVIDTMTGGTLRYRSWDKPRPLTDKPDLELIKGEGSYEGTQLCAIPIYTFKNGKTVYKVFGGTGCDEAPEDATGNVDVTIGDNEPQTLWCY